MTLVMAAYLPEPDVSIIVADGRRIDTTERTPGKPRCPHGGAIVTEDGLKISASGNGRILCGWAGDQRINDGIGEAIFGAESLDDAVRAYRQLVKERSKKEGLPLGGAAIIASRPDGLAVLCSGYSDIVQPGKLVAPFYIAKEFGGPVGLAREFLYGGREVRERLSDLSWKFLGEWEVMAGRDGAGNPYRAAAIGCGTEHFRDGSYPLKKGFRADSVYGALCPLLDLGMDVARKCDGVNANYSVGFISKEGALITSAEEAVEYARMLDRLRGN